jgi:hypothetical protein
LAFIAFGEVFENDCSSNIDLIAEETTSPGMDNNPNA